MFPTTSAQGAFSLLMKTASLSRVRARARALSLVLSSYACHWIFSSHSKCALQTRLTRERADLQSSRPQRPWRNCLSRQTIRPRYCLCTHCFHRTPCTNSNRPCSKGCSPRRPRQTGCPLSHSSRRSHCSIRPASSSPGKLVSGVRPGQARRTWHTRRACCPCQARRTRRSIYRGHWHLAGRRGQVVSDGMERWRD